MSENRRTTSTGGTSWIICPFFRSHGNREIICEGLFSGCTCGMKFENNEDKEFHKTTYCENGFKRCEYYLSVMHWRWPEE